MSVFIGGYRYQGLDWLILLMTASILARISIPFIGISVGYSVRKSHTCVYSLHHFLQPWPAETKNHPATEGTVVITSTNLFALSGESSSKRTTPDKGTWLKISSRTSFAITVVFSS